MFDRRLVQNFDWGLLGLTIVLAGIGMVILYSAVNAGTLDTQRILVLKQLIWFGVGLVVMVVCFLFDYKLLERWALPFYIFCLVLLAAVLGFGRYIGGSRRWLSLGPVSVQPSEIVKIAVIVLMARYYSRTVNTTGLGIRELAYPAAITGIPFALIVAQPDLGTALLLTLIVASMTFFVKINRRALIGIAATSMVALPLVWFFFLKAYQKRRVLTFLNPDRDPLGAGYHIIQSKIAIGSGMILGKGFLKGTQNALDFLPEQHTDFIFSVLAEEWGFIGSLALLLFFLMLILWGLNIAQGCRDPFGTILAVGITATIFWQVFINLGMVTGLMPVVGVPLPLVSYGGSSVLTTMICIGLLLNISMRRFMIE